jgi:hypothetical protein
MDKAGSSVFSLVERKSPVWADYAKPKYIDRKRLKRYKLFSFNVFIRVSEALAVKSFSSS